nr:hypothetical protein [Rhodococcus sp. (in: high G+C Gram-positive bacteria)]
MSVLLTTFGFVLGLLTTVGLAAFSDGTSRSDYAFAGQDTISIGLTFTEAPVLYVICVLIVCALIGWLTAVVLVKRDWTITRLGNH